MAAHHEELLDVAQRLLSRRAGQRGKLSGAHVRRSISTTYYAIFQFVSEECARSIIGSHHELRRRRRVFARVLTHAGVKAAFDKIRGSNIDPSVAELLRPPGIGAGPISAPPFARDFAPAFADAQAKRHDADYDLNKALGAADARLLLARVSQVIQAWRAAGTPENKDFKQVLCVLLTLKGQVRPL